MSEAKGSWNPPGRSGTWRFGMLAAGLVLLGIAAAIYVWPQIIVWAISGVFALLGAFFVVSAILARGGGTPPPGGVLDREPDDA